MASGGARPGAGRKPGSITIKTRKIAERVLEEGQSPLEYLLSVMRDETADDVRRMDAAKSAAPYVHAKLSSVEAKVDVDARHEVTTIELIGAP